MSEFNKFEEPFAEFQTEEDKNKEVNLGNLYQKLLERAESGEHTPFEFICNFDEFLAAQNFKKAIQKVARGFQNSSKEAGKLYLKSVKTETPEVALLFSVKKFRNAGEIYQEEIRIADDMLAEYKAYCAVDGNFYKQVFDGAERDRCDYRDFRKK